MAGLKRIVTGGAVVTPWIADAALTLLRVFAGLAMALAHGWDKFPPDDGRVSQAAGLGMPFEVAPTFFAWVAATGEFIGGLLVAIGLFTRPAAAAVLSVMIVAAFIAHAGDPFGRRELALLFGFVMLAFVFIGSGRFSVDRFLR